MLCVPSAAWGWGDGGGAGALTEEPIRGLEEVPEGPSAKECLTEGILDSSFLPSKYHCWAHGDHVCGATGQLRGLLR